MKTPEEMAEEYCEENHECEFARDAFLAGYRAHEKKEKLKLAELYSHGSEVQQIAAQYVKQRGTTGPMAAYAENRFIDGYQAARLSSEGVQAAKPQWISVKDRLPEIGEYVLITHRTSEDYASLKVMEATRISDGEYEIWGDHGILADYVDYWMPMPKAPKGEG
jgi:hypothetical protein